MSYSVTRVVSACMSEMDLLFLVVRARFELLIISNFECELACLQNRLLRHSEEFNGRRSYSLLPRSQISDFAIL